MKNYIKNRQKKLKRKRIGNIDVLLKDPVENCDPYAVIKKTTKLIPNRLLQYIDTIYIGQFDHLKNRALDASYSDGVIFLSNIQDSEKDMLDDLIHEISHSIEEAHREEIYSDSNLQKEFLIKREKLFDLLESEGFDVEKYSFDNIEYDTEFDRFLYMEVTYPFLGVLTCDLFYSPYGATSLREYFANGFEAIYADRDINKLSKISPILVEKIKNLL